MSETPVASAGSVSVLRVPTDDDLARIYFELGRLGGSSVGSEAPWPYTPQRDEELVCLASEMARYDARLLGVVVEVLMSRWRDLHPVRLREAMCAMRWPQTLCVSFEFARLAVRDSELDLFARYVCAGVQRLSPVAHFFVDDVRPGTRLAEQRAGRSLVAYSRWGFVGIERPTVDPFQKRTVGTYDAPSRRMIIERLLERKGSTGISLADYLRAIDHSISRQQARVDLEAAGLAPVGRGPGVRWTRKGARRRS